MRKTVTVLAEAAAPVAYLIPPQWQEVIERLEAHGVAMQRVERDAAVTAGRYRFEGATWAARPFEGRHGLSAVSQTLEVGEQDVLAGSVLEAMAREMMAKDPALKAEFEARVASDTAFAANPRERLRFFYMRSPYFDTEVNRYPVLRLDTEATQALRSGAR